MSKCKVLLIDDSDEIHQLIKRTLSESCEITSAYNYTEALRKFEQEEFAIVIIDLNLGEQNGMDLLREFKSYPVNSRYFILTGKDSTTDELLGHTYGVDEYIKKPVNRDILRAIVLKNMKILKQAAADEIYAPPFHIFPSEHRALMTNDEGKQEELTLTLKEFKILVKLVSNPDKPFSREELFNQLWESDSESTFRTIDMHVSSLRKKLGPRGGLIKTIHQVGYKFSNG